MLNRFALRPFVPVTAAVTHIQCFHACSGAATLHREAVQPILMLQLLDRRTFDIGLDRLHFSDAFGTPSSQALDQLV